jgi:hypothetical protein
MRMRSPATSPWILALLVSAAVGAGCASSPATPRGSAGTDPGSASASPAAAGAPQPRASPVPQPAGSADAPGPYGPGQTSEERRAALDRRLNDSLGSFDAELRQQQQQVAQERDARQAAAAANTAAAAAAAAAAATEKNDEGAGSASVEGPDAERSSRRGGPPVRRHDPAGDLKSEKAAKAPDDNAGNGATATEIPDGSDDDVVARRLRQAAQRETDPELKEKLWKEYRDYKRNAQESTRGNGTGS